MIAPALAPDATPAQRVWAAIHHIALHPEDWNQNTFGARDVDGKVVGCLAHHIARMAGLEPVGCCPGCRDCSRVALSDVKRLFPKVADHFTYADPDAALSLDVVVGRILGVYTGTLFDAGRDLAGLRLEAEIRFGPDPIQGAVDEVTRTAQHAAAAEIQDITHEIPDGRA